MHSGPHIKRDGLVFGYDTGYGVADNSTATRFYPGGQTVNYATDTPSQGGWSGTYNVLNSSRKSFRFNISNFAANPGAGWRSFTWDLRAYTGQSVTISATVEVPDTSPGTFAWIMIGQTNTHTSNSSGAGMYLGYSTSSERVQKTTLTKERITWSGILGNSGTASQPSGHVGFTVWYNNGTPGTNSYVEVSEIQIELNSYETPFVNGTRSSTQSLIDLTKTTNIDVSNVSFDSTGQPTFDGTDDSIILADPGVSSSTGFSIELIIKPGNASSSPMVIVPLSGGIDHYVRFSSNGALYLRMIPAADSSVQDFVTSSTLSSSNYHHVIFTFKQSEGGKAFYNGNLENSSSANFTALNWTSTWRIGQRGNNTFFYQGELPVLKVYNRALSADEVQQNFRAYKNRFNI